MLFAKLEFLLCLLFAYALTGTIAPRTSASSSQNADEQNTDGQPIYGVPKIRKEIEDFCNEYEKSDVRGRIHRLQLVSGKQNLAAYMFPDNFSERIRTIGKRMTDSLEGMRNLHK
jgi:hypothetical protein